MIFDPFGDFETAGYLQNSLGLKDPNEVKQSEHLVFELGIEDAISFLSSLKSINYTSLLKVHEILFADFIPGPDVTAASWSLIWRSLRAPLIIHAIRLSNIPKVLNLRWITRYGWQRTMNNSKQSLAR